MLHVQLSRTGISQREELHRAHQVANALDRANGELSGNVLTYMASILERRKISFCFTGSPGLSEIQGEEWRRLMAGVGV